MLCPNCRDERLAEKTGKNGLIIDHCRMCKGIWLDGGELYLLSKTPQELEARLQGGLSKSRSSDRVCPRCETAMRTGSLLHPELEVEQCPQCEGLWFDKGEVKQAIQLEKQTFDLPLDDVDVASVSYFEIRTFTINGQERTCYAYHAALGFAVFLVAAGLGMLIWAVVSP